MKSFYRGKRVLITGHTGFKGAWLSAWLTELGADVAGYALKPYTHKGVFCSARLDKKLKHVIGDVRDFNCLNRVFLRHRPHIVFHLAAQPIVRDSYLRPKETYDINVGGTVNVLECARLSNFVRVIINCTSDKCYHNLETKRGYKEEDRLGGCDPYSSSKACSEILTQAYRMSFFGRGRGLATVRAGNVIGGGDWRNDRLIPDCVRALNSGSAICVRNPRSIRPWQYILEPIRGYMMLAQKMYKDPAGFSGSWNFGPMRSSMISVGEVVEKIIYLWGSGRWFTRSKTDQPHEAGLLYLNADKARTRLLWDPVLSIDEALEFTVRWYKRAVKSYRDCLEEIDSYCSLIKERRAR